MPQEDQREGTELDSRYVTQISFTLLFLLKGKTKGNIMK